MIFYGRTSGLKNDKIFSAFTAVAHCRHDKGHDPRAAGSHLSIANNILLAVVAFRRHD